MANSLKSYPAENWHAACKALGIGGIPATPVEDEIMSQPSLFAREDTLLGVCEGLGEETGLHPLVFRVGFAMGLFWNPLAMIVAYLAIGVALAAFRWRFPPHRASTPAAPASPALPQASNDANVTWAEVA